MRDADYIKALTELIGVDFNNDYFLEKLDDIDDLREFVLYCEKNIDHEDLAFKKSYARLLKLKELFFREINKDRIAKAGNSANELLGKVAQIQVTIRNECRQGTSFSFDDFYKQGTDENFFTNFELSVLNKIGSPRYVADLYCSHELENRINKIYESIILKTPTDKAKQKALEERKVLKRIANVTKHIS